jgi:DNA-binding transcriptional regulator YiaG
LIKSEAVEKSMRYMGFGFPIYLVGVKNLSSSKGHSYLDIPHHKLAQSLFLAILMKPSFLSGAELKFLRKHLNLTQQAFAKSIGVKGHSNIAGWEGKGQDPTGMLEATEILVRLKLAVEYTKGSVKIKDFYSRIVKPGLTHDKQILEIDVKNVA